MRREDITGQLFGRLTAVSYAGDRKWNCLCECSTRVVVYTQQLKNGHSTSCGCFRKEHLSGLKTKNLVGMKFGRLDVISHAGTSNKNKAKWLCRCDCGKPTTVIGSGLLNGTTSSCGCLRTELAAKGDLLTLQGKYSESFRLLSFLDSLRLREVQFGFADAAVESQRLLLGIRWLVERRFHAVAPSVTGQVTCQHQLEPMAWRPVQNEEHGR